MIRTSAVAIIATALSVAAFAPAQACALTEAQVEAVCFTPGGDCTGEIVDQLQHAQRTVLVQAYSFTSTPIAKALVAAKRRGVDVRVILDKSQRSERYSSADFVSNLGVPVWIDAAHAIAHNKVTVIDGDTVITGSFNFTKAAQTRNAENLIVLRSASLADRYAANWRAHLEHSEPYTGRGRR